jgi:hypothetical protein
MQTFTFAFIRLPQGCSAANPDNLKDLPFLFAVFRLRASPFCAPRCRNRSGSPEHLDCVFALVATQRADLIQQPPPPFFHRVQYLCLHRSNNLHRLFELFLKTLPWCLFHSGIAFRPPVFKSTVGVFSFESMRLIAFIAFFLVKMNLTRR